MLEALGLPVNVVADKLSFENLDLPAGKVVREGRNIALRTKGEFKTTAEIENVILRSTGGSTVRVKDVGSVVDGYKERESTTRLAPGPWGAHRSPQSLRWPAACRLPSP